MNSDLLACKVKCLCNQLCHLLHQCQQLEVCYSESTGQSRIDASWYVSYGLSQISLILLSHRRGSLCKKILFCAYSPMAPYQPLATTNLFTVSLVLRFSRISYMIIHSICYFSDGFFYIRKFRSLLMWKFTLTSNFFHHELKLFYRLYFKVIKHTDIRIILVIKCEFSKVDKCKTLTELWNTAINVNILQRSAKLFNEETWETWS